MKYKDKTKEQLMGELAELRHRIEDLEAEATKRKAAEEALKVSEIRYRRLFETAQDGIVLLDADTGQILDVNPFLIKMLGYSHEDFLGKKLWEIGPFRDTAASRLLFSELQTKGYVRYEHLPLETRDGRLMDVEFVSNVYLVDHSKIIQCNIRDISLRKQAEDALRKAYDEMDLRVKERTADLVEANRQLLREVEERKKAEESLRETLNEVSELKENCMRRTCTFWKKSICCTHTRR
ncbi:MAG: PAS domain S-box protein [Comamonadaceae bacterium]|nr:PAS domain S-box protein [Comamonadaceae bacterium]